MTRAAKTADGVRVDVGDTVWIIGARRCQKFKIAWTDDAIGGGVYVHGKSMGSPAKWVYSSRLAALTARRAQVLEELARVDREIAKEAP